ncbi:MAG: hypothetical protein H0T86_02330, partial [Gemmatimonadales bacterium]|nr:hypothetical protein [Gemmatimonadales bacterium]
MARARLRPHGTVQRPAPLDELLDPLATRSEQKISAADLRELPVSSLEEAIALSAGTVGQSYRGGRIGEESFIVDGLGVKNQLDAASGALGLRLPPDLLGEASLVTNGFSARYGQALSGLLTWSPGIRARPGTAEPPSKPTARSGGRWITASTALPSAPVARSRVES